MATTKKCAFCGDPKATGVMLRKITNDRGRVYEDYVCSQCWKEREAEIQNESTDAYPKTITKNHGGAGTVTYSVKNKAEEDHLNQLLDTAESRGGSERLQRLSHAKGNYGLKEAVDIIVKLREKDYDAASKVFTELMQRKVNSVLMEVKHTLLVSEGFTKKALIRDPETPVGQPGKMHLICVCGNKVDMQTTEGSKTGGTCSKCGQKYDASGYLKESYGDDDDRGDFADPGGKSALRAGTRNLPCPTCKKPNKLTRKDKSLGYQCDDCADRDEGGYGY